MEILQLLLNGIQTGALYALIAVGFSLIFGMTKIFHAAHGATFTIAGFVFYYFYTAEFPWIMALILAFGASILFGILMDVLIYAPIQRNEGAFFTVFVASFGTSIVVQNVLSIIFGNQLVTIYSPISKAEEWYPDLWIAPSIFWIIVAAILAFALLHFFLTKTATGMALRALGDNPALVKVYGLSPRNLSLLVFILGSAITVPAAIFTTILSGIQPSSGHHIMLISIATTIVGGVGSIKGAALAGLFLGIIENLSYLFVEQQWAEATTFFILFLFIIFRPAGFFGRAVQS